VESAGIRPSTVLQPHPTGKGYRSCPAEVGLCGLGKLATLSLNTHFLIIVIFSPQKTPQNKKLRLIITALTCSKRTPGLCGLGEMGLGFTAHFAGNTLDIHRMYRIL